MTLKDLDTNSNSQQANRLCLDHRYSTTRLVTKTTEYVSASLASCLEQGGLRKSGYFKASFPNKPLISVITVVLNSQQYIEETIQSVINQTYDNVEYIIIDGGSTDGTLDKLKKYEPYIDYWLSGPDKGIYYAMNTAVDLTKGDWLNFMNSADRFHNTQVIEQVFTDIPGDVDIIYGDCEIRYQDFESIRRIGEIRRFWKGMPFCHQSAFCKASLLKTHRFDTSYKIAADLNFFYKAYKSDKGFYYYNKPVSSIFILGLSDSDRFTAIKENWQCARSYSHNIKIHFYYAMRMVTCALKALIKKVLGQRLTSYMQKLRNNMRDCLSRKK
jgi:glycosyltransferase involved in cell wall biosynthesis